MKKTASIALCALMSAALAGCSSTSTAADSKADSSAASASASEAQTILIGISPDYPPYESNPQTEKSSVSIRK